MEAMKGQVSSSSPPNTIISINYHINITQTYMGTPGSINDPLTTNADRFSFSTLGPGMIGCACGDSGPRDWPDRPRSFSFAPPPPSSLFPGGSFRS